MVAELFLERQKVSRSLLIIPLIPLIAVLVLEYRYIGLSTSKVEEVAPSKTAAALLMTGNFFQRTRKLGDNHLKIECRHMHRKH